MSVAHRAAAMYRAGETDAKRIAATFGVTSRTVNRWLVALGVREARPYGDDRYDWPHAMLDEGMPIVFAAEGTGIPYYSLAEYARRRDPDGRAEAALEWCRVWGEIMHDEALLELHYEFAPQTTGVQQVMRAA